MSPVEDVLFTTCSTLWWAALACKLSEMRRKSRNPAYLALLATLGAKGIALGLAAPTMLMMIDRYSSIPTLGILLQHLAGGVMSTAAILTLLALWAYPAEVAKRQIQIRVAACGCAGLLMIVLWSVEPSNPSAGSVSYLVRTAHDPAGAAYTVVYATVMGAGLVEALRLCWSCVGSTQQDHWLRRGLKFVGAGSVCYMVHVVDRLRLLAFDGHDVTTVGFWLWLSPLAISAGVLFLVIGLTSTSWGPWLSVTIEWLDRYRTYRKLEPLWSALYQAVPEIALELPSHWTGNLRYRLHRRVIEIQDGRRFVRPYLTDALAENARADGARTNLTGLALDAFVEARQLTLALEVYHHHDTPMQSRSSATTVRYGNDFDDEHRWLTLIADTFRARPASAMR